MEVHENAPLERFAFNMCNYIYLKLGVIKCDCFEGIDTDGLFKEEIGKAVLYHRLLMKDCLTSFFTKNFNRIVADAVAIAYEFCSRIYFYSHEASFSKKFFQLCACVMELFLYCRESGIHDVSLCSAPRVWKKIFDAVLKQDFRSFGGWDHIATEARLCCEKLSSHFEPLIEHIQDPYDDFPDIADLPSEYAHTGRELDNVFKRSYDAQILSFLPNIPPPVFLSQLDMKDDEDEFGGGTSSPSPKRFKRVHKVFDY